MHHAPAANISSISTAHDAQLSMLLFLSISAEDDRAVVDVKSKKQKKGGNMDKKREVLILKEVLIGPRSQVAQT